MVSKVKGHINMLLFYVMVLIISNLYPKLKFSMVWKSIPYGLK